MEAIVFMGLQASGKSTFYPKEFYDSHIRINLDMLKTRHRENILFLACLEAKQPLVIDNTNPTAKDRSRYIGPAKENHFRVIGYYFQSALETCLKRNEKRLGKQRIPDHALLATYNKLELPTWNEGFDELYYVRILENTFKVEEWADEI